VLWTLTSLETATIVCAILYALALIYPLLECFPKYIWNVRFEIGMGSEYQHKYESLLNPHMNHGTALFNFGEAAEFGTVSLMTPDYQVSKIEHLISSTLDDNIDTAEELKSLTNCIMHLRNAVQISLTRTLLFGVFDSTVQVNFQTDMYALHRAVSPDESSHQMVFSLATNILMSFVIVSDAWNFISIIRGVDSKIGGQVLHTAKAFQRENSESNMTEIHDRYAALTRRKWALYVSTVCCILGLAWAGVKLTMIHICDTALWSPLTGCFTL